MVDLHRKQDGFVMGFVHWVTRASEILFHNHSYLYLEYGLIHKTPFSLTHILSCLPRFFSVNSYYEDKSKDIISILLRQQQSLI